MSEGGSIDWAEVRTRIRTQLWRRLGREDPATLEDLTQVATIRLLRVVRREPVRSLRGLETTIANRTAASHVRRRTFERNHFQNMEGSAALAIEGRPVEPWDAETSPELFELVVQEILRRARPACLPLWRAYKEFEDWRRVSERMGKKHDAVRKSWSRCLRFVREQLARDPRHAGWLAE